jgi:PAS domain S-box-containing protein
VTRPTTLSDEVATMAAFAGSSAGSPSSIADAAARVAEANAVLADLAGVFLSNRSSPIGADGSAVLADRRNGSQPIRPENGDARYRALVEQMPAVVFMAYLDQGIAEAYVSPQIEAALGFSQREWLEDPIRWYQRIHPDDKDRWSVEAAEMFISGGSLRSAYRVIARDGRVLWFHCQAGMIRQPDGRPWFIHGVGIDITDLKEAERALQEERNLVSTILETVAALVVVLDPTGRIVRFNRACEFASGHDSETVNGRHISELFESHEESARFTTIVEEWCAGTASPDQFGCWITESGDRRIIAWSATTLRAADGHVEYIIATGNDVTERKRLEAALLDISGREQRRIGQDLHDGLGQHLTGTAFMSKVLQQRLEERALPEAADADKIVRLVNEAIEKTRELSRGLVPVVSGADGLMVSLQRFALEVEDLFAVSCRFVCDAPVPLDDVATATHLFHIVQEAVTNATKHGRAPHIVIGLTVQGETGRLTIEDDGIGIGNVQPGQSGMGLHIMRYRANMIGGTFGVKEAASVLNGTIVECRFPMRTRP